ncbi:ester cyclase [Raoultella ornithinolytica]|uniref:ester cyclase n=1 Tax=Raoultella ornithinolytica TaxID=54291 RepID=UPI00096AB90A|nr:ester cyclase [Raoultella ornithinolytica]EKV6722967.1 ester cyclase [Raoultella ornithinolytica]MCT8169036.1 ester cyclase [Raoultella ornithinolytica]MDL4584663.1 ester cyclase [Raoultella ornithinolytica]HCH7893065.1 ester cyclase [Raoultella ornithinolytica]HDV8370917.1 ester cyclase [Raoultella ornithinolytica]
MQKLTIYPTRLAALMLLPVASAAFSASPALVKPHQLIAENSRLSAREAALETVARRYATFWNTGDEALAREALADNFVDKTPPEGRKQGPEGALLASRAFRTAVPDLSCEIEQMIVAGDRVVSHLHFRGHFTGTFGKLKGKGQQVDFIATDIYQVRNNKIIANWHLEDNLTLMKQLGGS